MSTNSFRTHVPGRHNVLPDDRLGDHLEGSFKTFVAVRPARLVFHGSTRPRTDDLVWEIWRKYRSDGDKVAKKAIHVPFVYRGQVDAHVDPGEDVRVRLSEEPSGRPLIAQLPWAWFTGADIEPYKGFPFRLVTWMVEKDDRTLEPRHWLESLLETSKSTDTL